jgi:hypothetical protein
MYLRAGVVFPPGRESKWDFRHHELAAESQTGREFTKSFSSTEYPGFTAWWFTAIVESKYYVYPTMGIGYALSFFVKIDLDGSVTEYKYAAPELPRPGTRRAMAKDAVCIVRS